MRILAIDPGITTGYVQFTLKDDELKVLGVWQCKTHKLHWAIEELATTLVSQYIDHVVIEDYRIYKSMAATHIGQRLYTAELIGAMTVACRQNLVGIDRMPAQKKRRWPRARLARHYPHWAGLSLKHAKDALKIGLAWAEKYMDWSP